MISLTIQNFAFNCYRNCYYMDTSAGYILQTDAEESCLYTSVVEFEPALNWNLHSYDWCYTDSELLKLFWELICINMMQVQKFEVLRWFSFKFLCENFREWQDKLMSPSTIQCR